MRALIIFISLFHLKVWATPITDNNQISCNLKKRCALQPTNQKIKPIFVHFSEKNQSGQKSIFSVNFSYPRGASQANSIKQMETVNIGDPYELRYVDLDGDSFKDLALKVSTGTNINHYHYWRYSQKKGRYISLGIHEEVAFNTRTKKLQSVRRRPSEKIYNFELSAEEIIPVNR